jgi:hypothetical protein
MDELQFAASQGECEALCDQVKHVFETCKRCKLGKIYLNKHEMGWKLHQSIRDVKRHERLMMNILSEFIAWICYSL